MLDHLTHTGQNILTAKMPQLQSLRSSTVPEVSYQTIPSVGHDLLKHTHRGTAKSAASAEGSVSRSACHTNSSGRTPV